MYYKILYKNHRNSKNRFFKYVRSGVYIKGTHEPGKRAFIEFSNGKMIHGKFIDDCIWNLICDLRNKGYWVPIWRNAVISISKNELDIFIP